MSNSQEESSKTMPRTVKSPFKTALATVPRVMRSRIVKATKQRPTKSKKSTEVNVETQPTPGKDSSNSGATPTEVKAPVAPASDGSGETAPKSPKEHRKGTILNPEMIEVPIPDEQSKKLRRREMESLQQKAIIANLGRGNCGKQASKGKLNNRIGMINQPKKGF